MVDKSKVSFMRSLCMGQIEEDVVFPFPKVRDEERDTLKGVIDSLESWLKEKGEDFRKWDKEGEYPPEFVDEMKQFGMFSMIIPEEFGGMGFGATAYSRVLQEICKYDGAMAVTVGAHSSIGMRGLLLFGSEEQKRRYYPKLATGETIAAFCLTEPGAGSDAGGLKTKAVKEGDSWVLNGNKLWITNGGIASFFTVFARTDSEDPKKGQITAFIVTKDMSGVSVGPHEDKMGIRASSTTTVHFDNVRVPADHVLGEVGKGFKVAMKILNSGRSGLGGGSIGGMKRLIEEVTKQAKGRVQFGRPISDFALIKEKVAQMVVDCYTTEAVVTMIAGLVDQGYEDYAVEAAISKVYASECLWRSADEALQIAAGNGYMKEYPYERFLRDSRINRIFEGANEILRLFIALTGMNDVGTQLKELSKSLEGVFEDPIKGFGVLSDYAKKRVSLATGIGREKGSFTKVHPLIKEQASYFEDGTTELANAVDRVLRKYGKKIIGTQLITKRIADVMIDLYVLACTISRVDASIREKGADAATKEIEILKVFKSQARRRIRANMAAIDYNKDELLKSIADHAFEAEKFSWDTI